MTFNLFSMTYEQAIPYWKHSENREWLTMNNQRLSDFSIKM